MEQPLKIIRCRDLGFACNQAILAESEEEALTLVAEHAQTSHGVHITPEVTAQVQSYNQDLSDEELDHIVGGRSRCGKPVCPPQLRAMLIFTNPVVR